MNGRFAVAAQIPEVETAEGDFVQQGDEPQLILTTGEVRTAVQFYFRATLQEA